LEGGLLTWAQEPPSAAATAGTIRRSAKFRLKHSISQLYLDVQECSAGPGSRSTPLPIGECLRMPCAARHQRPPLPLVCKRKTKSMCWSCVPAAPGGDGGDGVFPTLQQCIFRLSPLSDDGPRFVRWMAGLASSFPWTDRISTHPCPPLTPHPHPPYSPRPTPQPPHPNPQPPHPRAKRHTHAPIATPHHTTLRVNSLLLMVFVFCSQLFQLEGTPPPDASEVLRSMELYLVSCAARAYIGIGPVAPHAPSVYYGPDGQVCGGLGGNACVTVEVPG
jgi:hypothetical protein